MRDIVADVVLPLALLAIVGLIYWGLLLLMSDIGFERTVLFALTILLTLSLFVARRVFDL